MKRQILNEKGECSEGEPFTNENVECCNYYHNDIADERYTTLVESVLPVDSDSGLNFGEALVITLNEIFLSIAELPMIDIVMVCCRRSIKISMICKRFWWISDFF